MEFELVPFEMRYDDLSVSVAAHPRGGFCFVEYTLRGDLTNVVVPQEGDHERADELWLGSCFELFVKFSEDSQQYLEYNVGFDGRWNLFQFDDHCEGKSEVSMEELDTTIRCGKKVVRVSIMLPWEVFQESKCGFAAVLKHSDGSRSFWALGHDTKSPDLHNDSFFNVTLAPEGINVSETTGEQRLQGVLKVLQEQDKLPS